MSSSLYRLGRLIARRRWRALGAWLVILVALGATVLLGGGKLDDAMTIPGTEAQEGISVLHHRFPEFAGASGVVVFHTSDGSDIAAHRPQIENVVTRINDLDHVVAATDPFGADMPAVSPDNTMALSNVQLDSAIGMIPDGVVAAIQEVVDTVGDTGVLQAHLGGAILQVTSVHVGISEVLGVLVAAIVLVVTFGSLLAAGMPMVTAIVGVGIGFLAILAAAAFFPINSTTPTLAIMIGLAVGIDYSLFILSRHRANLATGMAVEESIARSVATAGSAVVFAGVTVILALVGLFVAGIPFLSIMGIAAAFAVFVAVAIALTGTPALMALGGERLRPKAGSRAERLALVDANSTHTFGAKWVRFVTKWPAVTVITVIVGLAAMALPARDLQLSLPDGDTEPAGSSARIAYDLVSDGFGAGYNSPLLVTADIIRSLDPLGTVKALADEIATFPGVDKIAVATPNRTVDLAVITIIPLEGRTSPLTTDLIHHIREVRPDLEATHDVANLRVTGTTAATIDISERLGNALLPFGLFVIGLSVLLLMVVFRSIWVPIKATLGYLLSVLAAFGAVVAVFTWGHGAAIFGVDRTGPVIAFLPIILMGILFGLAMDYEVFLVSRMREDFVHTGDAHRSIRTGFTSGARVVAAAAFIMIAVFAAFIPEGDAIIKPIAFGMAIGVFFDAFIVRMTLVPAAMALLGKHAWWLPKRLAKHLPALDVEGAALTHHLEHEEWTATHGAATVRMESVELSDEAGTVVRDASVLLRPGEILTVVGDDLARLATLNALTGRLAPSGGRLVVLDRILPDEAGYVRSHTRLVTDPDELRHALARPAPSLLAVDASAEPDLNTLAELAAVGTTVVVGVTEEPAGDPDTARPDRPDFTDDIAAFASLGPVLHVGADALSAVTR